MKKKRGRKNIHTSIRFQERRTCSRYLISTRVNIRNSSFCFLISCSLRLIELLIYPPAKMPEDNLLFNGTSLTFLFTTCVSVISFEQSISCVRHGIFDLVALWVGIIIQLPVDVDAFSRMSSRVLLAGKDISIFAPGCNVSNEALDTTGSAHSLSPLLVLIFQWRRRCWHPTCLLNSWREQGRQGRRWCSRHQIRPNRSCISTCSSGYFS